MDNWITILKLLKILCFRMVDQTVANLKKYCACCYIVFEADDNYAWRGVSKSSYYRRDE
jgi:hypothetical protein